MPHEKNFIQLKKNYCLGKKGGVSQVGMSFFGGGLRSEWMKSGHGGGGGQKRPKMGGRPLYTVPNNTFLPALK